tara:strand:+ start:1985 stop:3106 length:1122 start_codon:yes stop_codon:yes gene_type:complete
MCIIANVPVGTTIDKPTLETMWQHNSDGAGIAWIDEGKVRVFKTMKLKPFLKKFEEVQKTYGDSDILVHMRIATHGSVCMDNNHPFNVDTQTVFAHNGILPQQFHPPAKRDISDTRYFNETFLQYQKLAALDDSRYIDHLGSVIGSFNKLVILTANPKLRRDSYIINESSGEWADGVWYSNDSYLSYSRKMKWGTASYVNKLTEPAKSKPYKGKGVDQGDSCDIKGMQEFDIEVCDSWGLIPTQAWEDEECADMIVTLMTIYGYDAPQDMMEDFAWEVRDNKIRCQHCKAVMDINQNWPDCGADCLNYTDGEHLDAQVDFHFGDDDAEVIEVADDINEDWFVVEENADITRQEAKLKEAEIEQQVLFDRKDNS